MQSFSKTSEIDKHKTSKDDKHGDRYKIPSDKNTINEHPLTSSYNVQYFMYNRPITGCCHPPLNEMVTSWERIYSDNTQLVYIAFCTNVRCKCPASVQMSTYWCFGSKPCSVLRWTFKFLILVKGLAGSLLHPATLHGKGPTLSGFPAQVLKWSSRLFCFMNPSLPHPLQTPFPFPSF